MVFDCTDDAGDGGDGDRVGDGDGADEKEGKYNFCFFLPPIFTINNICMVFDCIDNAGDGDDDADAGDGGDGDRVGDGDGADEKEGKYNFCFFLRPIFTINNICGI